MAVIGNELKIDVYLVDGTVRKFVQRNPEQIQKILADVHPRKLFEEKFLRLAEPSFMTIFPSRSVVRVDFIMQGYPEWAQTEILEVMQITPETFRIKSNPERGATPKATLSQIGQPFSGYCEFDLATGQRIPVEIRTIVPARSELGVMLSYLLDTSTVVVKRIGGGIIFVNMSHAIRFRLHPQHPTLVRTAIPVNRVVDKEEFEKYEGRYS
jgi:hypothetical protein